MFKILIDIGDETDHKDYLKYLDFVHIVFNECCDSSIAVPTPSGEGIFMKRVMKRMSASTTINIIDCLISLKKKQRYTLKIHSCCQTQRSQLKLQSH